MEYFRTIGNQIEIRKTNKPEFWQLNVLERGRRKKPFWGRFHDTQENNKIYPNYHINI